VTCSIASLGLPKQRGAFAVFRSNLLELFHSELVQGAPVAIAAPPLFEVAMR
jgi:hypothetical protein